eukprot:1387125-Amorphochlora_amoeboformis.AAC.2
MPATYSRLFHATAQRDIETYYLSLLHLYFDPEKAHIIEQSQAKRACVAGGRASAASFRKPRKL